MSQSNNALEAVRAAGDWDARVAAIRRVPELIGRAGQRDAYARIADELYVPALAPDFAYVHWTAEYDLGRFMSAYGEALRRTGNLSRTTVADLAKTIRDSPGTLRVLRVIAGLLPQELAELARIVAAEIGMAPPAKSRVKTIEAGREASEAEALVYAHAIDRFVQGTAFPAADEPLVLKSAKPDTNSGWETVRVLAQDGVPYGMFLHQRHYGGAFRQLLDATSGKRGDMLEDSVESVLAASGIPFVRTTGETQGTIRTRFGITVHPGPDFVVYEAPSTLRAMIECKKANDGGTARDKASRYAVLQQEASRLGGISVIGVLSGVGWRRTGDALGPVVRDTEGRVFTPSTIDQIVDVQPLRSLVGKSAGT